MKKTCTFSVLISLIFLVSFSQAQEKKSKYTLNTTMDLVNTYVWRGTVADQSPNLQPGMSVSRGAFTLGAWASGNFTGTYKEVDLYLSYAFKNFTLTVNDYCWSPLIDNTDYFDYADETTGHIFEGMLVYKGPEKFPLSLTLGTMLYGADKKVDKIDPNTLEVTYVNQYSTYFEAGYTFKLQNSPIDVFMGLTPQEGYYGNTFGVTNVGFTGYRKIKISSDYELPLKGSLIFNPQASRAYFMLTMSL